MRLEDSQSLLARSEGALLFPVRARSLASRRRGFEVIPVFREEARECSTCSG